MIVSPQIHNSLLFSSNCINYDFGLQITSVYDLYFIILQDKYLKNHIFEKNHGIKPNLCLTLFYPIPVVNVYQSALTTLL